MNRLARTEVRALTACSACGAQRGETCRRARYNRHVGYVRVANHRERVNEAQRVRALFT